MGETAYRRVPPWGGDHFFSFFWSSGVSHSASFSASQAISMVATPGGVVPASACAAHPNWFSYLYTQAEEYAKLKGVCAAASAATFLARSPPTISCE